MDLLARKAKFLNLLEWRKELRNQIANDNPSDVDSTIGVVDVLYFFDAWREYRDTVLINTDLSHEQYQTAKQTDWLLPNRNKVICYVVESGIAESNTTFSLLLLVDYFYNCSRFYLNIHRQLLDSENVINKKNDEKREFERAFNNLSLPWSTNVYQQIKSTIEKHYPDDKKELIMSIFPNQKSILDPLVHSQIRNFLNISEENDSQILDKKKEFDEIFKNPLRYFVKYYLFGLNEFCKKNYILQPIKGNKTRQDFFKMVLFFLELMGIEVEELMKTPYPTERQKLKYLSRLLEQVRA